jgi:diacylglycerol kinase family enzyme
VQAVPFQVDGEIRQLDAAASMVIECVPHALATVG